MIKNTKLQTAEKILRNWFTGKNEHPSSLVLGQLLGLLDVKTAYLPEGYHQIDRDYAKAQFLGVDPNLPNWRDKVQNCDLLLVGAGSEDDLVGCLELIKTKTQVLAAEIVFLQEKSILIDASDQTGQEILTSLNNSIAVLSSLYDHICYLYAEFSKED